MVNWGVFSSLPGAADTNFEMLCRALIRRHYGGVGEFAALANQPGVEFDLRLHSSCSLGDVGRWYGWQCRWYDLPSGRAIGTTRRKKIKEALAKTETERPGLTDWVLWTRHLLTEGDQKWFRSLSTHMRLHLWTAAEVEEHLSGPADILRSTYFGELVLTPDLLRELHATAVARVKRKWQPEVHQVVEAERELCCALGAVDAWSNLSTLAERLTSGAAVIAKDLTDLPVTILDEVNRLVRMARALASSLIEIHAALGSVDHDVLHQQLTGRTVPGKEWDTLVRRLRAARHPTVLPATNVLADMRSANAALAALHNALVESLVAVVADAGCGKTELAAQLTAAANNRPAGVLIYGADLHADHSLNDLAHVVVIHGCPVPSFEALLAAVDAAGQRAGRRLPIVIDGLNEAEDPRVWKGQLASLSVMLQKYPYVLVTCTLRSAFASETLPDDLGRLEIPGFEHDAVEAVQRYFHHYRIDPADAELPWSLLEHPLTLRMFCEVTNPERKQVVGVEAMPGSLTALLDRYLEQVAERITELASAARRYYESDVRTALNQIGLGLWEENTRSLDIDALRRRLGDETRPWNQSIVRALEHDGVLLRVPSERPSAGHVEVIYDALAGHLIADALLDRFGGQGFNKWLVTPDTATALRGDLSNRHPLATDIFRAMVGLTPRRMHRRQLWAMLNGPSRRDALHEAAWLDAAYLDHETVSELATLAIQPPTVGQRDLFDRLLITRAARGHPLDANFLDAVLRPMEVAERDLRWTEWVRRRQEGIIADMQRLEEQWRAGQMRGTKGRLRARWAMWTLTSTVHLLRDHATRALYWFGCGDPDALFELTLEALAVNDPYVPERMLAACYGVAMSLWADERGSKVRAALPKFANNLVDRMFVLEAPNSTRHALMRDSSLGVILVASKVAPGCVPENHLRYLKPPFDHLPSPFPSAAIDYSEVTEGQEAIHMDFGNYTIGRLIPERRNYDYKNADYKEVRRQIEHRIADLGYSSARFAVDRTIGEAAWRAESHGRSKIDRYGKKYSWIAYFEMHGLRHDHGTLPDWRAEKRPSDVDIDPSFPGPARTWKPLLRDPFVTSPVEPRAWLADGPTPDYDHLLHIDEVDGRTGPWVLLDGYVEQSARDDTRRVFTFLRSLLVRHDRVGKVRAAFDQLEYPGNTAIADPERDYYTYAGEIPWSPHFGSTLRNANGKAKPDHRRIFDVHDGKRWLPGIPVEVPVYEFAWEGYHSSLNEPGGITLPAPALCERLHLSNRQREWDLHDSEGRVASMYRQFKSDEDTFNSNVLYLRADLLATYLARTKQTLVWLVWGERGFDHRTVPERTDQLQDVWSRHEHIHRRSSVWVL